MKLFTNKIAFTLAEVLITLAVIGILAAITIPSLVNNINDEKFKKAYKVAYSDLSNAFNKAKFDNELTALSSPFDNTACEANMQAIARQMSVTKVCDGTLVDCWDTTGELYRSATPKSNSGVYGFLDAKGRAWFYRNSGSCNIVLVDTNGFEKPNQYGKDRFPLMMAYQTHLDDPDTSWITNYLDISGIPIKIHPFNDKTQYAEYDAGGYVCGAAPNCYYKSWLK